MRKVLSRMSKVGMLSIGSAFLSVFGIATYGILSRISIRETPGIYRQLLLYFSMVMLFLSLGLSIKISLKILKNL